MEVTCVMKMTYVAVAVVTDAAVDHRVIDLRETRRIDGTETGTGE